MRRPVPLVAALLAAAWLVPSATPAGRRKTIEVFSITTSVHRVDQPPKGVSDGDTVSSSDRLVNAKAQFGLRSGARVGNDHGRFTYTGTHTASYAGEASLPGGTVTVRGAVIFPRNCASAVGPVGTLLLCQLLAVAQLPLASTFHIGLNEPSVSTTGAPTLIFAEFKPVFVPVDSNHKAAESVIDPVEPLRKEKLMLVVAPFPLPELAAVKLMRPIFHCTAAPASVSWPT